jgi:hypothetical protein
VDGGYAEYEFDDGDTMVRDSYTSTYGVAVGSPTWDSTKTSANGVYTFDGSNYIAFDKSILYLNDDVEFQTAILWRGGSGDIFKFGDDGNSIQLTIGDEGYLSFGMSTLDPQTGKSMMVYRTLMNQSGTELQPLETGKWYTIKVSVTNGTVNGTDSLTASLVVNDGSQEYVTTTTNTYAGFKVTPLDVVRNVDDEYLIFGRFNGSADYFRVSYKEDAYDSTYYYTQTEEPTEVVKSTLLGDLNCDGVVNILDVLSFKNYVLNPTSGKVSEVGLKNADIDQDGVVSTADLLLLKRSILRGETL